MECPSSRPPKSWWQPWWRLRGGHPRSPMDASPTSSATPRSKRSPSTPPWRVVSPSTCLSSLPPSMPSLTPFTTSREFRGHELYRAAHRCPRARSPRAGNQLQGKPLRPGLAGNATIGRAFRFILQNIGGAIPGDTDRSTFGHQGKFSSCIGENEEASPWPPLHVERGLERSDSAVTVIAIDPHIMVNDASSTEGEGVLQSIASSMMQAGSNNALFGGEMVVILGPEHVDMFVRDGWDPPRIRAFLYERGRVPTSFFAPANLERARGRRGELFAREDLESIPSSTMRRASACSSREVSGSIASSSRHSEPRIALRARLNFLSPTERESDSGEERIQHPIAPDN